MEHETRLNTTVGSELTPDTGRLTGRLTGLLWAILAVVVIADMLDLMDSQITNIAAPSIVRDLGGGESLIKWLGAGYQLAMGTFLVVGGRLGDRYGKRRLFLIGITGFVIASLLCGLAPDPTLMIVGRLIQGSFGALLIPQGISILMASFSREQLPMAFSVFAPVLGLSAVLGPILGGFIVSANLLGLHWRPVFLINIVLGGFGLFAARRVLPRDRPAGQTRIDGLGSAALGAAMLTLIFGLIEGSTDGWTVLPIVSLIAGLVFAILFALRQRTAAEPLIEPSLLRNRGFTAGLVMALVFFAAVAGISYVLSLFFQLELHFSAGRAALALSPSAIGFIISSFVSRPLIAKLGRMLVLAGLLVTLLGGGALLATVSATGLSVSAWGLAPSVLVLGLGMGTCIGSLFDVAIGDIDHSEAGSASGSLSAVQQLSSAIGAAVVTTVFFNVAKTNSGATAMTVTTIVVLALVLICLALVWLLPRRAAPEAEPGAGGEQGPVGDGGALLGGPALESAG